MTRWPRKPAARGPSPLLKATAAARVLMCVVRGEMDDKAAGIALRAAVGRQWTMLSAKQYLTGKEAMGALQALPPDWEDEGIAKQDALQAVYLPNDACANAHSAGTPISAGLLVQEFKDNRP